MRLIEKYLEVFNKDLINKANNAKLIFSNTLSNLYSHKNKKIWKTIMMYKEVISSNSIENINTNYTKIVQWLDLPKHISSQDIWTNTRKTVNCLISYIESKNILEAKQNIDSQVLLMIQKYLDSNNKEFNNYSNDSYVLKDYLTDLENFLKNPIYKNELGYIIQSCFAHFQIISIKPFHENNALIARLSQLLMLCYETNNDIPKFSLSSFILAHRQQYNELLESANKSLSSINKFINFLLLALCEACIESENILKATDKLVVSNISKLVELFIDYPILNSEYQEFCNLLTISKKDVAKLLNIKDIRKLDEIIELLLSKNIIQYISNEHKNKFIFTNIWNYLIELDKQLIKWQLS